jgi:hypothetical protein
VKTPLPYKVLVKNSIVVNNVEEGTAKVSVHLVKIKNIEVHDLVPTNEAAVDLRILDNYKIYLVKWHLNNHFKKPI